MEYASNAKGNLGVTLGAIGTGLGALGGLGGLLGGMANNAMANNCGCGYAAPMNGCCSENTVVNRYENSLVQQIAAKDSENALLRSNIYTDGKLVEVVKDYTTQINALKERLCENEKQQAMYNGATTATINCMTGQITQLFSLTKLGIPNSSLCPGYGTAVVTPPAAAAAA